MELSEYLRELCDTTKKDYAVKDMNFIRRDIIPKVEVLEKREEKAVRELQDYITACGYDRIGVAQALDEHKERTNALEGELAALKLWATDHSLIHDGMVRPPATADCTEPVIIGRRLINKSQTPICRGCSYLKDGVWCHNVGARWLPLNDCDGFCRHAEPKLDLDALEMTIVAAVCEEVAPLLIDNKHWHEEGLRNRLSSNILTKVRRIFAAFKEASRE